MAFTCGCGLKADTREEYAAHLKLNGTTMCKLTRKMIEGMGGKLDV